MPQLTVLGCPITVLLLYFCFYSFLGWCMETVYCSVLERRFVARGFLHGPLCPIYGAGVLMMILFFRPLAGNILVFYLVSTLCMSAWEYFVGWFLEVTTHMKYWDYSMYRFNLKGRICLWVCLTWGALSYLCIFWIHPPVEALVLSIPQRPRDVLALVLAVAILADAVVTIRELALMTKAMNKLQALGGELQVQMALGRMELADRLSGAREAMAASVPDPIAENAAKLKAKYDDLLSAAERTTRRFRNIYVDFSAPRVDIHLRRAIREKARQFKAQRKGR